jgi:hypothetical protein
MVVRRSRICNGLLLRERLQSLDITYREAMLYNIYPHLPGVPSRNLYSKEMIDDD